MRAFCFLTLLAGVHGFVSVHRPDSSTWHRTPCGHPGGSPAISPRKYTENIDLPGNDMSPCGKDGCEMNASATETDCLKKCQTTTGCVAFVFAPSDCSGKGVANRTPHHSHIHDGSPQTERIIAHRRQADLLDQV